MSHIDAFHESSASIQSDDTILDIHIPVPNFKSETRIDDTKDKLELPALWSGDENSAEGAGTLNDNVGTVILSEIPDSDAVSPSTSPVKGAMLEDENEGKGERSGDVAEKTTEGLEGSAFEGRLELGNQREAQDEPPNSANEAHQPPALQCPEPSPLVPELPAGVKRPVQDDLFELHTEASSQANGTPQPVSIDIYQIAGSAIDQSEDLILVKDVARLESPSLNDTVMLDVEDSLPNESAGSAEDVLSHPKDSFSNEVTRTEIPPSDDEEAVDEDTPIIDELHTTHGTFAEDCNIISTDVEFTKKIGGLLANPTTAIGSESYVNGEFLDSSAVGTEDGPTMVTNIFTNDQGSRLLSEVHQLDISLERRPSGSVQLDTEGVHPGEGFFSSMVEFPPSSVYIPGPSATEAGVADAGVPDKSLDEQCQNSKDTSMFQNDHDASAIGASFASSICLPEIKLSAQSEEQEATGEVYVAQVSDENPIPASPAAQDTQTQASVMSSIQLDDEHALDDEVLSSPPKPKENMAAPARFISTPMAHIPVMSAPQEEDTKSKDSRTRGKRKAASVAPKQSLSQAELSTPKKMVGGGKASSVVSDESPSKDVLFEELKAMKIASIQARNASLEAEIAGKRARLAEVTQELEFPAAETVKKHIKLLHDYNDIRDVGQGLVGMIADNRNVRIGDLYDEFGVGLKD